MENKGLIKEGLSYYYKLQYRRFLRKCNELQVLPLFVIVLIVAVFILLSSLVFHKITYTEWIYPSIGLGIIAQLNSVKNTKIIHHIFSSQDFQRTRCMQAFFLALPFVFFLLYKYLWIQAILLFLLSLLSIFIPSGKRSSLRLPTPFRKKPFEFIVGFRKSILLILIFYFLIFKGIQVGNENLAYASMGFIHMLSISFLMSPEDQHFVWISNASAKTFLWKKILTAIICASLLTIPGLLAVLIAFPHYYLAAIFIYIVAYMWISTMILAKYSVFPKEMNLPQAIILGVSFLFPPLLIYTIPSFYRKARKQLELILEC